MAYRICKVERAVRKGTMDPELLRALSNAILDDNLQACKQILSQTTDLWAIQLAFSKDASLRIPPLHVACMYRRAEIIQYFLKEGADVSSKDPLGRTPIQIIIAHWPRAGPWDRPSDELLDDIEKQFWAKMKFSHDLSLKCLLILLAHGANANQTVEESRTTSLHICAQREIFSAIDVLLMFGGDLERRDDNMRTPILHAATHGAYKSVRHLLLNGADHTSMDKNGCTVLHLLCISDQITADDINSLTMLFPQLFQNLNSLTWQKFTPLHMACFSGNGEKIKFLLDKNARIGVHNAHGQTPLFTLLDNNYIGCCMLGLMSLLEVTSQVAVIDSNGNLPKFLAQSNRKAFKECLVHQSKTPVSLYSLSEHVVIQTLKSCHRSVMHAMYLPIPTSIKESIINNKYSRRQFWQNLLSKSD